MLIVLMTYDCKLRVIKWLTQNTFHLNASKLEYTTSSSYIFIPLGGVGRPAVLLQRDCELEKLLLLLLTKGYFP